MNVFYILMAVLMGLVIFAHAMFYFGNWYWSRNYNRLPDAGWRFWRHSKTQNQYGFDWSFYLDTAAIGVRFGKYSFSFRYELFRLHFWSPFRKYNWTHWPLMFKLQSFCKPSSGWLGAKWRILFGPFDFAIARPRHYGGR